MCVKETFLTFLSNECNKWKFAVSTNNETRVCLQKNTYNHRNVDLMVIVGIALVLMESIMVFVGLV